MFQTVILNVAEVLYALVAGRTKRVGDVVYAWTWNLRRLGELRDARQQVRGVPATPATVTSAATCTAAAPG